MALLKILHFPHPKLRMDTKPILKIDAKVENLIDNMFETMYDAKGVGLAATQIGSDQCIAVIDISRDHNQPLVLINPEIIESKDIVSFEEGCLSVPGHYDTVKRANWVKLRAQDRHGKCYEIGGEGLLAECIQHELDHLKGKLYIDYLSSLKRKRIRSKVEKYQRRQRKADED